jgi:SAM-dependent methyltransferase
MDERRRAETRTEEIYRLAGEAGAEAAYDAWAGEYEADVGALGFRLPGLCAGYLARHLAPGSGPVLDAAAGTGLVGAFLQGFGYEPLHALDISAAMLARARASGVYSDCRQADLGAGLEIADGTYAGVLIVGALGPGHAPPGCLAELARVTRPGGVVVLNVIEESYVTQGLAGVMADLAARGIWEEIDRSPAWSAYADPGRALPTRVFVFRVR